MNSSTPLRVLFLGKDAGRGGMQKELLSIAQFLDRERFSPLVLLQSGGDLLPFYKQHAPTHVYSESPAAKNKKQPSPRAQRWVPDGILQRAFPGEDAAWADDLARHFDPQIIVRQYMRSCPMFANLENSSLPTLQTFLMAGAQTERLSEENLRWNTQHPIVCTGRGVSIFLERCLGVDSENIHEICTGLDLELIERQLQKSKPLTRADAGLADDEIVIATSGNIVFLKGVDIWVEAAASIRARFPELRFKFMWIGGAKKQLEMLYAQSIQKLIRKRGLENHVFITGDQEEIYPHVNLCDIYVQPSRDDAYPLATREAMALGKPVVAFPQGIALEDYARHALIVVPRVEPEPLADAIVKLMKDAPERARLGTAGRKVIEDHLEIKGSMRRYEELLLKMARSR